MLLKDRVLLVTNVTRFSGHGVTERALAWGATVLAHDPAFEAPSARRKYETQFAGAHALSPVEPEALVALALKRYGRIDALVNNDAWPALRAPLGEARMQDYRDALEAMAVAPFRMTQLVAPAMRARKAGRIVFVSSAAPLRGIANYAPYVSARAATLGLVQSLAKELGRDGVTVNAVGSNYVENPEYFPPALLADAAAMKKMTAQIPLGRLGKASELASTVCFLCSEGAGFVTGQTIAHAGGWA
ncbi:MAG: SDR family oxidoreductase [Alphaproteobacteria bacterium]|nr:SDR family oxidoreductase [Alphaproteobacteria bacterium]